MTKSAEGLSRRNLLGRSLTAVAGAAAALPTSMIGETYAQLLQMAEPELNVVVASPREPLATQGGNAFIEDAAIAENKVSAFRVQTHGCPNS